LSQVTWLGLIPEAVRRRLYAQAVDSGSPLAAFSVPTTGTAPHVTGARWSRAHEGRDLALCFAPADSVGEGVAGAEVVSLTARHLCFPQGDDVGAPMASFTTQARALVTSRDGLGLFKATQAALEPLLPKSRRASVLRWVLAVLEVGKPDEALVLALLQAIDGDYVAPSGEAVAPTASLKPIDAPSIEQATQVLQSQLMMLSVPCEPAVVDGRLLAVGTVVVRVLRRMDLERYVEAAEESVNEAIKTRSAEPARRFLTELLELWKADLPVTPAAELGPEAAAKKEEVKVDEAQKKESMKVLKVEPERIEALMTLVGELVVAKNGLPFLARRAEDEFESKELGRAIKDQYAVVNRITEELQAAVMRVRMVPMSAVFRRFPRLVRDLSGKLNKRIRLDLEGEDTEADKDVVQDLFDPLMHLMRNSIDHGLEGPEERERAGKSPEGTIALNALQQEDQVVIEISDDGRGIDPERIKRKAIEKGFLKADDAAKLSHDEALQLIFLPGFSTAEQVTDLSGRGVGMDVVRSMVSRVGGRISLQSTLGKGTVTTINLPLTMAVSHVMVVEVGGIAFGIPFSSIVETVRVPSSQLKPIQDGEGMVLRGRLVPVCRLSRVLDLPHRGRADGTEAVLVARAGGELVAFVIDEFQQAVDVIAKPLEGVLKGLRRFSGTALLGDGRLLLILDLDEVVQALGASELTS
jgi:two-component system chemotaxis sensor kinase CheA